MFEKEFEEFVLSMIIEYKKKREKRLNDSVSYEWSDVERLYSLICMIKKIGKTDDKELYLFAKEFIAIYVAVVDKRGYGYDFLNYDKIFIVILGFSCRESVELLKYLKRVLADKGFSEDVIAITNKIKLKQYECVLKEYVKCWYDIRLLGRVVIAWVVKDVYGLMAGLFVLLCLSTVILLPNYYYDSSVFFVFDKKLYSVDWFVNHLLNVIVLFFSLDDNVAVKPLDWRGILMLFLERVLFWVIVVNYLLKEIEERYLKND